MNSNAQNSIPDPKAKQAVPDWGEIVGTLMKRMMEGQVVAVTGTGAALDVPAAGFDPTVVLVLNETTNVMSIHLRGMTAGTSRNFADGASIANGVTLGAMGEKKVTLGTGLHANAAALRVWMIHVPIFPA